MRTPPGQGRLMGARAPQGRVTAAFQTAWGPAGYSVLDGALQPVGPRRGEAEPLLCLPFADLISSGKERC